MFNKSFTVKESFAAGGYDKEIISNNRHIKIKFYKSFNDKITYLIFLIIDSKSTLFYIPNQVFDLYKKAQADAYNVINNEDEFGVI